MMDIILKTTENNLYAQYEKQEKTRINRKCIDGKITGCGNCVGYCQFHEHPGFLTEKHRQQHNCIKKKCNYYIPKPKSCRKSNERSYIGMIIDLAKQEVKDIENIRIIKVFYQDNRWVIGYITVFGEYDVSEIENRLQLNTGFEVKMQRLNYNFERCVELFLQ